MTLGGPVLGKTCVVEIGTTKVAKGRNFSLGITQELIKEYSMDQVSPEILDLGDQTYPFTIERMWVDSSYINLFINQTVTGCTIDFYPAGTATSQDKYTLANCLFSRWNLSADRQGAELERIEGEGKTLTVGVSS